MMLDPRLITGSGKSRSYAMMAKTRLLDHVEIELRP
jgi:hypothetical protein